MMIGIRVKLVISVLAVLLVAAAVACALVYRHVEDELGLAAVSEASFVLRQLQTAIEDGLELGLELEELPGMAALFERSLDDPDKTDARPAPIRSVAVFDETGLIVFSSRPAEVGGRVPIPGAPGGGGNPSAPIRQTAVGADLTLSLPLATAFGTVAGGVAVMVDRDALTQELASFGVRLLGLALVVYGLVGAAAVLVTTRIARAIERRVAAAATEFQTLTDSLTAVSDQPAAVVPGVWTLPPEAGTGFGEAVRARRDLLHRADAEIGRLDELA